MNWIPIESMFSIQTFILTFSVRKGRQEAISSLRVNLKDANINTYEIFTRYLIL